MMLKISEFSERPISFIILIRFDNTEVNKDIEKARYIINNVCDARAKGIKIAPEYR